MIVTFLAILELVKESLIDIIQKMNQCLEYILDLNYELHFENIIECLLLVSDEPIIC